MIDIVFQVGKIFYSETFLEESKCIVKAKAVKTITIGNTGISFGKI